MYNKIIVSRSDKGKGVKIISGNVNDQYGKRCSDNSPAHNAIRNQDTMSCVNCGKCWDVDDTDVPPCQPINRVKSKRKSRVRSLRRIHNLRGVKS